MGGGNGRKADFNSRSVMLVAVILNSELTRIEKGSWRDRNRHGL
jgi:hypothetical protein